MPLHTPRKRDDMIPFEGIDPQTASSHGASTPYNAASFAQIRVTEAWLKYDSVLTWGENQCLAILDDGCDLNDPAWQVAGKVTATWNSIDGNEDCAPLPPGYHGTSVGYPSSINLDGTRGLAYRNSVAQVLCITVVHLRQDESQTIATGLRWVADNAERLNITAVNLSALDDKEHQAPVPTAIDAELQTLRQMQIWVSAPTGNNNHTQGISWPACQPYCFGIGATIPGQHAVHLDRYHGIDLLVCARATSSSNAYAAASAQVLREAIEKSNCDWQAYGATIPDAILAIFQHTGDIIHDGATGLTFRELDLLAALNEVFGVGRQ